jgi:CYTH domain-containing protein
MNTEALKYSRMEYARRFLVPPEAVWKKFTEPYQKRHDDKYLSGSRLRLRILTDSDSDRQIIKLTKKHESESPYFRQIKTIILTTDEYRIFYALKGKRVTKIRHYHHYKDLVFSIDVFENELSGLVICEIELNDLEDLMSAIPPPYVTCEVTEDPFFTGAGLARKSGEDLSNKLASLEQRML